MCASFVVKLVDCTDWFVRTPRRVNRIGTYRNGVQIGAYFVQRIVCTRVKYRLAEEHIKTIYI